jgi:very-short-patch-repair endonuclease
MERTFWTTAELRSAGWSKTRTAEAVSTGELTAVRRGHYATAAAPPQVVRAVRVGRVATATTAGPALGLWTPDDDRLHVALAPNAGRLHDPDDSTKPFEDRGDVVLHWTDRISSTTGRATGIAPLLVLLQHSVRVLRPELAIAMLDSALHVRLLRERELPSLAAVLPAHLAAVVRMADGRCESGMESIACYLLRLAGLRVEPQVMIPGVGRVDLLVEGRLIVELDGRQWHDTPIATGRDRRRDAAAAIQRYRTLRFDAAQVFTAWPSVQAAVFGALA